MGIWNRPQLYDATYILYFQTEEGPLQKKNGGNFSREVQRKQLSKEPMLHRLSMANEVR